MAGWAGERIQPPHNPNNSTTRQPADDADAREADGAEGVLRAELPGNEAAGHAEEEAREELLPALEEFVRVHVARREEEQAAQGRQCQARAPHHSRSLPVWFLGGLDLGGVG